MKDNHEKRSERTVVWLDSRLIPRMDGWLEADNCKNRSEFINKALRFYMGYCSVKMFLNTLVTCGNKKQDVKTYQVHVFNKYGIFQREYGFSRNDINEFGIFLCKVELLNHP